MSKRRVIEALQEMAGRWAHWYNKPLSPPFPAFFITSVRRAWTRALGDGSSGYLGYMSYYDSAASLALSEVAWLKHVEVRAKGAKKR